jgi:hypothetical protein
MTRFVKFLHRMEFLTWTHGGKKLVPPELCGNTLQKIKEVW